MSSERKELDLMEKQSCSLDIFFVVIMGFYSFELSLELVGSRGRRGHHTRRDQTCELRELSVEVSVALRARSRTTEAPPAPH